MKTVSEYRLSDFDYPLPEALIATEPPRARTDARLLCLHRKTGALRHGQFPDLSGLLRPGDVLVLNNTRVLPVRLLGKKETGGKAEVFLLKDLGAGQWRALLKPGGSLKKNSRIFFEEAGDRLMADVLDDPESGRMERLISFGDQKVGEKLRILGHMPLPPYIHRADHARDREEYQTVYAEVDGACAAPTAGLHFDRPLLDGLRERGVRPVYVTLHVSYGTFQPVSHEDLSRHVMFEEEYGIPENTLREIQAAKKEGRRVVACGTTSVRALESAAADGPLRAGWTSTRLFIKPPYDFKITDALITNFHLPQSTLLMLVSAFGGFENVRAAYREAVARQYRFFSYGDAMFISGRISEGEEP